MAHFDMVKFQRGQVWMIRFKRTEASGREQEKDRPWLVLSIGKFNQSSGMITCVPITSRDEVRTPAQVLMTNTYGKSNVIMCEQIRSFDYRSGNYIFDFIGNVSDEILEKVDVATSIHLGMHYSPITLNKLYDSMEAIIKSVVHMQKKADTPKFTDDDVLNFAEKLQLLADTPANEKLSATSEVLENPTNYIKSRSYKSSNYDLGYDEDPTPYHNYMPDDINRKIDEDVKTNTPEISPENQLTKKKRIKWDKETCEAFINDANTLPMKDVISKWGISKKPRFYSMKNYAEGLLRKMTE